MKKTEKKTLIKQKNIPFHNLYILFQKGLLLIAFGFLIVALMRLYFDRELSVEPVMFDSFHRACRGRLVVWEFLLIPIGISLLLSVFKLAFDIKKGFIKHTWKKLMLFMMISSIFSLSVYVFIMPPAEKREDIKYQCLRELRKDYYWYRKD